MLTEVGFVIPNVSRIQHTKLEGEDDDPMSVLDTPSPDDTPVLELEPTPVLCDNKGTVFTANNPVTNLRSRHLEVRWFKVRDYAKNGLLAVLHLCAQSNLADYFTKPLAVGWQSLLGVSWFYYGSGTRHFVFHDAPVQTLITPDHPQSRLCICWSGSGMLSRCEVKGKAQLCVSREVPCVWLGVGY